MSHFEEFVADLEAMDVHPDVNNITSHDQRSIGSVYGTVKEFLVEQNLVPAEAVASIEAFEAPVKQLNAQVRLADLGAEAVLDLCRSCGIPDNHLVAAAESVTLCVNNYLNNYSAARHFAESAPSSGYGDLEVKGMDSMYSSVAMSNMLQTPKASLESFGAYMDNTISDAKVAITIAVLRFHRSVLHRFIPSIPTDANMVTYKVDHMEMYDMNKSRDKKSSTRFDDKHRIPFVDLYRDPSPANTELRPINVLTANDEAAPNNKLIADNVIKIGEEISLFDYSLVPGQIGYDHVDYTDLVGDNVRQDTLYIKVTDGTTEELLPIKVNTRGGARFIATANNADSSDRVTSMNTTIGLDNTTVLDTGATSTLLGALSNDAVVKIELNTSGQINLKSSITVLHGSDKASLTTKSTNPPIAADTTVYDALTFTLVGYKISAHFSEENTRKTTKSLRILTKQFGYEIPGSKNYMVQYSLTQSKPDNVIDGLTKLISIGIDDRGIKLVMDGIAEIKDRIAMEANLIDDNYVRKIGNDFVSGQRVKPYVYVDTLAISPNLANMRSEERWGDMRSVAEEYLLDVMVRIFNESYYSNELGPGEKPVFNVLTSGWIKDSLLSVPHYHDLLRDTAADAVSDGAVEFRRTLPNGTVLNVVTTNFNYLTDKMIIVPVRPNAPRDTLNFAQNRERGTFIAQATPTVSNSIYNVLIANSREIPIVLTPVAAQISVTGLSKVFAGTPLAI